MKIIITEQQNLFLRRRLEQIDEFVKLALKRVPTSGYSYHEYVNEIVWYVIDEFGKYTMYEMESIGDYIRETYWKYVFEI